MITIKISAHSALFYSIYFVILVIFHFGVADRMQAQIVRPPGHCLLLRLTAEKNRITHIAAGEL